MVQVMADLFTLVAIVAGFWAAFLWWYASKVPLDPDYSTPDETYDKLPGPLGVLARTIAAVAANVIKASGLNRRAAMWTAISVAAQAAATLIARLFGV